MGDDKSSKDQLEEVKENKSGRKLDIDGREGIRKAFSSVLNLLSQPQVTFFGDTSTTYYSPNVCMAPTEVKRNPSAGNNIK